MPKITNHQQATKSGRSVGFAAINQDKFTSASRIPARVPNRMACIKLLVKITVVGKSFCKNDWLANILLHSQSIMIFIR
jgi:hypothetical protein